MKNKKTIYNSDEFRKTVQCLTEKIREAQDTFKSNSCHKYDTIDYYQVDPSFGTTEDLKELVQKSHERGMKVVLDAVYNHSGREFFAFQDILEKGEKSKYLDWYFIDELPA